VCFTSSPSSSSFEMPSSSYDILPNGISNDDYVIQNSSKKHDPQWAANASRGIISSHGNQLLEVQKLLQELTEHQDQILESIPLTEDAVLWASHTREFIEQVEKLPEYTKKAQAIEAEMQNLTKRIQRAKERVQKLKQLARGNINEKYLCFGRNTRRKKYFDETKTRGFLEKKILTCSRTRSFSSRQKERGQNKHSLSWCDARVSHSSRL